MKPWYSYSGDELDDRYNEENMTTETEEIIEIKCWPEYYKFLTHPDPRLRKNFEFRTNDRPYKVGSKLLIREWCPITETYSGNQCERVISYILDLTHHDTVILSLIDPEIESLKDQNARILEINQGLCIENTELKYNQGVQEDYDKMVSELAENEKEFNPELLGFKKVSENLWHKEMDVIKTKIYYYELNKDDYSRWACVRHEQDFGRNLESILFDEIRIPNHIFGKQLLENLDLYKIWG